MISSPNAELIQLLNADDVELRTIALHWLSEGYASDPEIVATLFAAWDQRGVGESFPEFPMLSHLPIPAERVEECCQRATTMVRGRALTEIETRCAGKLIEHLTKLTASALRPHLQLLESTVAQSKVYFRVDLPAVRHRVELLDSAADYLAGQLDESIDRLSRDPDDAVAVHHGIHALEALRQQHPNYMNLSGVFANPPPDDGPQAVSFQLTLQSLIRFSEQGLESVLENHLQDPREPVFTSVIDALVRIQSPAAANAMIAAYVTAADENRKWIARGLQRVRVKGLGDYIAGLRDMTHDPHVWLMLLVAEIRQAETNACTRIADGIGRVMVHSYALVNALLVYTEVLSGNREIACVTTEFAHYLDRVKALLDDELKSKQDKLRHVERRSRDKARQEALKRFRKG